MTRKIFCPDEDLMDDPVTMDDGNDLDIDDEQREMFEHFRLELDKGQMPMRVDKYMATHLENTSRNRIQLAIKQEYVKVNGKTAKANTVVRPGDVISFVMPYQRRGLEILPENIPLNIVYEDDDLLVLNKDAGMVVHPGHGHFSGTLVNALAYHLGISQGPDAEDERMGVLVHRIDKDTSGLLVVAKNDEAHKNLAAQIAAKTARRIYFGLVDGNVKEEEGTVDAPIARSRRDRKKMAVDEKGRRAVTHYKVLERYGAYTLVRFELETGRTHQIRVHAAYIHHPIVGDAVYGGSTLLYKGGQLLHAKELHLDNPATGERMVFECDLPPHFLAVLAAITPRLY